MVKGDGKGLNLGEGAEEWADGVGDIDSLSWSDLSNSGTGGKGTR